MVPNKPRGVRRVNDRRVLNGIFWALRSGAPWRDLPENYGPSTTCYNRFVRWRQTGVWDHIMDALAAGHDAAVQMIDTSAYTSTEPASRTTIIKIWLAREGAPNEQDSRGGGHQWPADSSRPHALRRMTIGWSGNSPASK